MGMQEQMMPNMGMPGQAMLMGMPGNMMMMPQGNMMQGVMMQPADGSGESGMRMIDGKPMNPSFIDPSQQFLDDGRFHNPPNSTETQGLHEEIEDLREKLHREREANSNLNRQVHESDRRSDGLKRRVDELENSKREARPDSVLNSKEYKTLKRQLDESERREKDLLKANEDLKDSAQSGKLKFEKDLAQSRATLTQMRENLDKARKDACGANQLREELKKLQNIADEKERLKKELDTVKLDALQRKSRCQELQQQVQKVQHERVKLPQLQDQLKAHETKVKDLQQELVAVRKQSQAGAEAQAEAVKLKAEVQKLEGRTRSAEKEAEKSYDSMRQMEAEMSKGWGSSISAQKAAAKAQEQNQMLEDELERLRRHLKAEREESQNFRSKLDEAEVVIQQCRDELQQIRQDPTGGRPPNGPGMEMIPQMGMQPNMNAPGEPPVMMQNSFVIQQSQLQGSPQQPMMMGMGMNNNGGAPVMMNQQVILQRMALIQQQQQQLSMNQQMMSGQRGNMEAFDNQSHVEQDDYGDYWSAKKSRHR
ncbi:hypothetical protein CYMTET_16237 [Cymbomonas tetramitiformis]|uniref:E3 ubiquitin protein ligase n=1 Tax=Cymbomonas tetramitiformis TaxID=36881 RepID=A0AAE0L878_9CHLO|nr:hypothetical protein CYMTET_16237 [Cymbomonas tetramitiformis]